MEQFAIAENRVFTVDGHDFLFLVEDNAIFEMDADTKALLDSRPTPNEMSREQFLAAMEGSDADRSELFQGLVSRHIITPGVKEDPSRQAVAAARAAIPLKTLVLNVTDECNLGCLYCYHEKEDRAGGEKRAMTPAVAEKAVDFLLEHSGPLEKVTLVFFGGEPFLNFGLISSVTEYARAKSVAVGKEVDFAVTTNGTLLNDEAVRFVCENDLSVTVSIDGYEEIQDRYRPFRNGAPSYRAILPNVKRLLEASRRKPVVARVTVVKDAEEAPRAVDHLLDVGFSEVGLAPVTTRRISYQLDDAGMTRLLGQFKALSERFFTTAMEGGFFGFSNLIDLLVVLHEGEVKNYPCGAGLDLFSVDPEGGLYLCQRLTGEDGLRMGDVFDGFDRTKVEAFRGRADLSQKEPCRKCWARAMCAGGCYHEALVREGSMTTPNLHYCEWITKWIEIGMEIYCRLALHCPEYLDKLSALRGHADAFSRHD